MNRITRIAALALTMTAAGSAMAESIEIHTPGARQIDRPAVTAAATQQGSKAVAAPGARTRAEVQAELAQAIADGTLNVHGEVFASYGTPWKRSTAIMARAGR